MPDIRLENGQIVKNFPENPTPEDYAKLDKIKQKYGITSKNITPKQEISQLESAIRGGAQGLTFGFPDEATAALERLVTGKPYEQALQESRQAYKEAQEANPVIYTGSEIGGAILPALATGGGSTPLTLGRLATISAVEGGLRGLGYSEGQNIKEKAEDIGSGALLGGILPGVGRGITKAIQSIKPAADIAIKKGLQGGLGVSAELLTEAEKNPKAVEKILKVYQGQNIKKEIIPERAGIVETFMSDNPIAKRAIKNSRLAVESIPDDVKIDRNLAINAMKEQIKILEKSKGTSDVRNQAIKMLNDKIAQFQTLDEQVMGRDLKPILQGLDDDIQAAGGWQNPLKNNKYREGLENARTALDRDLKTQVPEYDRLMKKVSKDYQLSNNLTKKFATEKGFDDNKIANTLTQQLNKTDTNLQKDFKRLAAFGRQSGYENDLKLNEFLNDMALKRDIEQYGGKGSSLSNRITGLFTMAGSSLGGLPGGMIGTGIGSIAGSEAEKQGGQLALKALRATEGIRSQVPTQMRPLTQQAIESTVRATGSPMLNDFLKTQADIRFRENEMKKRGAK